MRQGQQNRRGRGRNNNGNNNNNNRKGQNPLTRSFESNGPDMKIRGTPAHIAEKYMSLGRDAMASGDRVLAENYLQHAEHYNRIIMTYREQQVGQGGDAGGQNRPQRQHSQPDHIDADDMSGSDSDDYPGNEQPIAPPGSEPQPALADLEGGGGSSEPRAARPRNDQRSEHRQDHRQQGRRGRPSTGGGERSQRDRSAATNGNGSANGAGNDAGDGGPRQRGNDRTRFGESSDQPDFLRRPIRRPRRQAADDADDAVPSAAEKVARDPAPADDTQD